MKKIWTLIFIIMILLNTIGCQGNINVNNNTLSNVTNSSIKEEVAQIEEEIEINTQEDNEPTRTMLTERCATKINEYIETFNQITTKTSYDHKKTLVHIDNISSNLLASGVIIDCFNDNTYILTNSHVLLLKENNKYSEIECKIVFDNGSSYEGIGYRKILFGDFAILKIPYNIEKEEDVYATPIKKNNIYTMNNLYFYNYSDYTNKVEHTSNKFHIHENAPLEEYLARTSTYKIVLEKQKDIQYNGCSGSGVFTDNGVFVGLISSLDENNDYDTMTIISYNGIFPYLNEYMEIEKQ